MKFFSDMNQLAVIFIIKKVITAKRPIFLLFLQIARQPPRIVGLQQEV
jgi:hypothetical protein